MCTLYTAAYRLTHDSTSTFSPGNQSIELTQFYFPIGTTMGRISNHLRAFTPTTQAAQNLLTLQVAPKNPPTGQPNNRKTKKQRVSVETTATPVPSPYPSHPITMHLRSDQSAPQPRTFSHKHRPAAYPCSAAQAVLC